MRHLLTIGVASLLLWLAFALIHKPEPIPPLVFQLSDGTQWAAPDEETFFEDAFASARKLGRTVVVTQDGKLVMIADPNHR